jgi:molybdopterin-guanine dinucleotide biosynthesis protein A
VKHSCTGVILAGGLGSRYGGENKAFLNVGGMRIMDRLVELFSTLFDEIIIVTNQPLDFLEWNALIVTDIFPARSSLTGIHTGLFYAGHPFAFFSACDTPFLKRAVVETVLKQIGPADDLIIPKTSAGFEPLCAAYSRRCLKPAEEHIRANKLKIQLALQKVRIKHVPEALLRQEDPELVSFFNVNTPEDLAQAEAIAAGDDGRG